MRMALSGTRALQDELFAEMKGRIKEDDSSVPAPDGPYAYFRRYRAGGQHPLICRMPREGGAAQAAEEVLLDADALAAGKAFFQLGGFAHSPDHRKAMWSATRRARALCGACAISPPAPTLPISCRTSPAPGMDRGSSVSLRAARCSTGRRACFATASAPPRRRRAGLQSSIRLLRRHLRAQSGQFAEVSIYDHETSGSG
jgi:hypothetical protein